MRRTALTTLALIVLVIFAGCNAFDGSDTAPLPTPAPIPTDAPTTFAPPDTHRLPQECAPLSQIGFKNASALAAAHNATMWNTSVTVRETTTATFQNGTVASHSVTTVHIAENYSRLHIVSEGVWPQLTDPKYGRNEIWTDGERVVTRDISGHTTHYNSRPLPQNEKGHYSSLARSIAGDPKGIVATATVCVTDQYRHNETTISRLAFTRDEPLYTDPNATVLRPVAGRALVDSRGVIHELGLEYVWRPARGSTQGAVVNVTRHFSFAAIGSTTVEQPLWYELAVNESQPYVEPEQLGRPLYTVSH